MIKVTIIYLEEDDDEIKVSVESIGDTDRSLGLCDEIMRGLIKLPQVKLLRSSKFTRPFQKLQ